MRNKFTGNCYRCGKLVEIGEGYFEKKFRQPGFRVQHVECCKKARELREKQNEITTPKNT